MKNSVLWGIQCTLDRTYVVEDAISDVARDWVQAGIFKEHHEILNAVATTGIHSDINIRLAQEKPESLEDLEKAKEYLKEKDYPERTQIGGNPGISALRAYCLGAGDAASRLPRSRYVGIYPKTVAEYVNHHGETDPALRHVFNPEYCVGSDREPQTISVESHHKMIIAYGPGREVGDLASAGDFAAYTHRLREAAGEHSDGKILVALSIPWPLEDGRKMLDAITAEFRDMASIFVGLSSLRGRGGALEVDRTKEIHERILAKADILSCNETELHDLHTVLVGGGSHQDIALPYKLKQLPMKAIKICHSADGAILELGCDPQRVIKSESFPANPWEYLQESLQLATDGATYTIDSVEAGKTAGESMVRIYSSSIRDRCKELFSTTFLKTVERLPGGIVAVHAPLVGRPLAAVTGLGAMFDGLLLSFLMRD